MEFIQQNWYWAALAAVSGTLLVVTSVRGSRGISPAQATQLINRNDAVVIDVRDASEYAAGHLLNAQHIPLAELDKRLGELDKLKDKPVILNCQTGSRSASACDILRKAGFTQVHNLEGGIAAWEQAGMPVSRTKKKK
ncbi:MAG: rhodanese-like domain-containing protein [Zoogloea sp.]|nr:rhodanese-like domain-containing protein [Zoogloea sp.]MCA0185182.1 rhodanese-like domain-containing protein [Pseudomonadota bacterium]